MTTPQRNPVSRPDVRYLAAGGVVVNGDCVLVLRRPSREEMRLPKGRVEPGEAVAAAAIREVREETGYAASIVSDLGEQVVEFEHEDRRWIRTERYFLMNIVEQRDDASRAEAQFEPVWTNWEDALRSLTFEAEREWVRRARDCMPRAESGDR